VQWLNATFPARAGQYVLTTALALDMKFVAKLTQSAKLHVQSLDNEVFYYSIIYHNIFFWKSISRLLSGNKLIIITAFAWYKTKRNKPKAGSFKPYHTSWFNYIITIQSETFSLSVFVRALLASMIPNR